MLQLEKDRAHARDVSDSFGIFRIEVAETADTFPLMSGYRFVAFLNKCRFVGSETHDVTVKHNMTSVKKNDVGETLSSVSETNDVSK